MKGPLTSFYLKEEDFNISWKESINNSEPDKFPNSLFPREITFNTPRLGLDSDFSSGKVPLFSIIFWKASVT